MSAANRVQAAQQILDSIHAIMNSTGALGAFASQMSLKQAYQSFMDSNQRELKKVADYIKQIDDLNIVDMNKTKLSSPKPVFNDLAYAYAAGTRLAAGARNLVQTGKKVTKAGGNGIQQQLTAEIDRFRKSIKHSYEAPNDFRQYNELQHSFVEDDEAPTEANLFEYEAPNDFRQYSELYHYGVEGMHWGIRRYQDKNGRLTAAGREHYGRGKGKSDLKEGMGAIAGGLLYLGVVCGITAAPYAVAAGVYGAAEAIKEGKRNSLQKKNAKELFKEEDQHGLTPEKITTVNPPVSGLTRKQRMKKWEEFKKANGRMTDLTKSNFMNCPLTTCTVELRKRGIDVTANPGRGKMPDIWEKWFNGCKVERGKDLDFVKKYIGDTPKGSSGYLGIQYKDFAGGHAIHWTNLGNGRIRIEDGQAGTFYTMEQFIKEYQPATGFMNVARLDNCKPNIKAINADEVTNPPLGGKNK